VCLFTLGLLSSSSLRAAAAEARAPSWLRLPILESSMQAIHIRKLARKLFHLGVHSEDESPLWLGPARARLFWQEKWKWPDWSRDQKAAGGLLGGLALSIDMPFGHVDHSFSLETRVCSFRYARSNLQTRRDLLEELADPQELRQSFEGGLYLHIPIGVF
jgi:hypothetical protein